MTDERPCVIYGMRGVVRATVSVAGPASADLHSGVDGGAAPEPLGDLTRVLAGLVTAAPERRIDVADFYRDVCAVGPEDLALYQAVLGTLEADGNAARLLGAPVFVRAGFFVSSVLLFFLVFRAPLLTQ